jgi:hypothetical protein
MELSLPFQSSVPATFIKLMKQNSFKFADGSVDYLGNTLYNIREYILQLVGRYMSVPGVG